MPNTSLPATESPVKRYRINCETCHRKTVAQVGTVNGEFVRQCESCNTEYSGVLSSVRDCPHNPICSYDERTKCHAKRADVIREKQSNGKRVRQVVDTGEVPHLWAHKAQPEARNAQKNLYFENETIYSYGSHFPIAHHVTRKNKHAVMFTVGRYSVTTSGHISAVRSAIPSGVQVFEVPHVIPSWHTKEFSKTEHADNIKYFESEINKALLTASRARSEYSKTWNHERATNLRKNALAYAKFFGLRVPKIAPIPSLSSETLQAIRKQEAERVARIAKETARKNQEAINAWLAGDSYARVPRNIPVLLRINGEDVETSLGARFPVSHAKRGLALVRAVISRGEAWQTNGHTCHLGHYQIDRIEPDGTVRAGCHRVPFSSIERIANQIEAYVSPVPVSESSVAE